MSEEDLVEIKKLLVHFYKEKVEREVQAFWNKKEFTQESWNEATRDQHFRNKKSSNS